MKSVLIIGGSQKRNFEQIGKKNGIEVVFHDGKTGGGNVKNQFKSMVKKADAVVIVKNALNHPSMWKVRELAEELGKPFDFGSMGATSTIAIALTLLNS